MSNARNLSKAEGFPSSGDQCLQTHNTLFSANTWVQIGNYDTVGAEAGSFFTFSFDGASTVINNGSYYQYWETSAAWVAPQIGGQAYNATASDIITNAQWTFHHRLSPIPDLMVDSDSTNGAYGHHAVYVRFPVSVYVLSPRFYHKRVL